MYGGGVRMVRVGRVGHDNSGEGCKESEGDAWDGDDDGLIRRIERFPIDRFACWEREWMDAFWKEEWADKAGGGRAIY